VNLYIDEGGDLGFSEKATHYFVVAFLFTQNEWHLVTDFKRLLKTLRQKRKYKHDELKFAKASDEVRKIILETICKYDTDFGFVILNKTKVHEHLKEDLNLLYRYIVIDPIMGMVLPHLGESERLHIVVDRLFPKGKLQYDFSNYVELKGYYYSKVSQRQVPLYRSKIVVDHVDSQREVCLQLVDCLAGAEFNRFERSIYDYHNIINPKIKGELFRFLW
jgi:hypothetical protein